MCVGGWPQFIQSHISRIVSQFQSVVGGNEMARSDTRHTLDDVTIPSSRDFVTWDAYDVSRHGGGGVNGPPLAVQISR